jgi:NAD(P)-dependent dehydrogenase (short-subunit alcohol dehydrogenase family)/quercetin dioxygenase-like cupin family protein
MTATNENGIFAGKVAFVTGAGSGMGRTTALAFAREGASVVLADVSDHGNQDTARMIEELGGRALAVRCDVTRSEDVRAALNQAVDAFGRLDVAFNNAGAEQKPSVTVDVTEEEWDRIIAINLRSVFLSMKYEIPLMLEHGGGAIVNNSSGAGIKAFGRGAAYAAAKHGVVGLTKDAALDYASSNIRINAVCPGIVDTEMMQRFTGGTTEGRDRVIAQEPIGRMGTPDEIAAAVLWLCSDAASFVIGKEAASEHSHRTAAKPSENAEQPQSRFKKGITMEITSSSVEGATAKGSAEWFTGDVYIDSVAAPAAPSRVLANLVHFMPGARTAWHSHPLGQSLFVTEGIGLVQRRGGPVEVIRPGDRVYIQPDEEHWHGAAPTRLMVHLALNEVDDEHVAANWGEHVRDDEYNAASTGTSQE